jgi:flagellar basal-body rod protein FlgC
MISSIQNNISALNAFDTKMQVTANNVANVNTNEFKKSRAVLSEGENGGVKVDVEKVDTPGYPIETVKEDEVVKTETSNVDIAEEFGESIVTQNAYNANLKMVKTQDEILGSLLDILG